MLLLLAFSSVWRPTPTRNGLKRNTRDRNGAQRGAKAGWKIAGHPAAPRSGAALMPFNVQLTKRGHMDEQGFIFFIISAIIKEKNRSYFWFRSWFLVIYPPIRIWPQSRPSRPERRGKTTPSPSITNALVGKDVTAMRSWYCDCRRKYHIYYIVVQTKICL